MSISKQTFNILLLTGMLLNGNAWAQTREEAAYNKVADQYELYGYVPEENYAGRDEMEYTYEPLIGAGSIDMSGDGYNAYFPSSSYYELLGPMKAKNGAGHIHLTNWTTHIKLLKGQSERFFWGLDTAFRMTWVHGKGEADVDVDRLYTIWLTASGGYRLSPSSWILAGFNPQISTDFDTWCSRDIYWGGHLSYKRKVSEMLTYSLGVAFSPQLGDSPIIPFFLVDWKINPEWTLKFEGIRLSVMNKVSDRFAWGPFCSLVSGTWTVNHNRHHERFEWTSGVLGITSETKLGKWGSLLPKLAVDVGMSFYNEARFKTVNGDDDLFKKRMDPGFYIKAGLQFHY